jgi:hypothetical protein
MLKKLFFSLLGLLSSVIALWGVVRHGWTWQMVVPAATCVLFFATALATGNRVPGPRRGTSDRNGCPSGDRTVTQRYQWGQLSSRNSA